MNKNETRLPEEMFIGSIKEQIKKLFLQATMNQWMANFQLSVLDSRLKSGEKMVNNKAEDQLREQKNLQQHTATMEGIAIDKLMLEAMNVGLDLNEPRTWASNFAAEENIGASLMKEMPQPVKKEA